MGPVLTMIISTFITKGLTTLAGKLLEGNSGVAAKIKQVLKLSPEINDDELLKVLDRLDDDQINSLIALDFDLKLLDNATKRLEIDNQTDSWFTRHVRPSLLVFLTVSYILFMYAATFIISDVETMKSAEEFANQLLMLLMPVYGFYFGGRTLEKLQTIKR